MYGTTFFACVLAIVGVRSWSRAAFALVMLVAATTLTELRLEHGAWDLSPRTELGRESGGLVVVTAWSLIGIAMTHPSPLTVYGLVGTAIAVVASVVVVPKWYLSPGDAIGHCIGVGFAPPPNA